MAPARALPPLLLPLLLLLLVAHARAACSSAQTGWPRGRAARHTELLRPGRRALRFALPPLCTTTNGVRASACEVPPGDIDEGGAGGTGGGGSPPVVRLEEGGRSVTVARDAAAGFAVLTVEVFCDSFPEERTERA